MVIAVDVNAAQEVGWDAREKPRCLIYLELVRVGVGTQLLQGCQDFIGPFPSVLLDKAVRIYTCVPLNKSLGTIKPRKLVFVIHFHLF